MEPPECAVVVQDVDLTIWRGDVREVLPRLEAESVDCVATSPPFYGLRDYGADGQIGLETSQREWVEELSGVFYECRRILKPTGTLWIECGDSYNAGTSAKRKGNPDVDHGHWENGGSMGDERINEPRLKPKDLLLSPFRLAIALQDDGWYLRQAIIWHKPNAMPESATDRCTTAHSYVFLLSKSPRYWFDADAIAEPAAWERWGDQTVPKHEGTPTGSGWIAPKSKKELLADHADRSNHRLASVTMQNHSSHLGRETGEGTKNARSVWTIPTRGYPGGHFATWPEALAERIIKAGCPEQVCGTCGAPRYHRDAVKTPLGTSQVPGEYPDPTMLTGRKGMNRERKPGEGTREITKSEQRDYARQLRDSPHRDAMATEAGEAFAHYVRTDDSGARPVPPTLLAAWLERGWLTAAESSNDCGHDNWRAGTVLDPFFGAGTTGLVARRLGRKCVGIELNAEYARLAAERCSQLSLLAEAPVSP